MEKGSEDNQFRLSSAYQKQINDGLKYQWILLSLDHLYDQTLPLEMYRIKNLPY